MQLFKFRVIGINQKGGRFESIVEQDSFYSAKAVIETKYKCTVVLCHII